MEGWQERVIDERRLLEEKIEKLGVFLQSTESGDLPLEDLDLLGRQFEIMREYSSVLEERIARFT
jgi:hypothetical protein